MAGVDQVPGALLEFLQRIWGRTHAQAITLREYELYACLQFLARANSRRFDSTDPVRYVVMDREQAENTSSANGSYPTIACSRCQ
jgi:hypothetical protein